jgi:hypothetical protein
MAAGGINRLMQSTQGNRRTDLRRFKPYPAYKDSGVEWLGEIPAHWPRATSSCGAARGR